MGIEVFVADEQTDQPVDTMRWVRLATQVIAAEGVRDECELSMLFVDEEVMAGLNKQFHGKDGPTDVLAFPIDDDGLERGRWPDTGTSGPDRPPDDLDEMPTLLGDVVVCPAVAAAQAPEHAGKPQHDGSVDDEIALLVVHGILHVLGHDHAEPDETAAMQAKEQAHLAAFHPRP